ncbi:HD domain-containing protein [Anaerocolumna sp. MB42-C2]|uniref:HD domain-containing protein n=1 Tax=Anaerocolumna sp. MB42-C2 TaxID=3070997 RepID=UPI0027E160A8|nr:HD domain-containing protein [Anaerocolumna sp. MB42-C2]WMJ87498.1 HD domain-containing protein [Anaerocolumna sp. MB42-C2]
MTIKEAHVLVDRYAENKLIMGQPYNYGHIQNAANIAYKIAKLCGMDGNKAYVYALLHDIGRFEICDSKGELDFSDKHRHPIVGYKILISLGLTDEANICITHAFLGKINKYRELYEEEENLIVDKILSQPFDDYDLLIQLADEMSVVAGYSALETRFARKIMEDGFREEYLEELNQLCKIKDYFDNKMNGNVYELVLNIPNNIRLL